MSRDRSGDAIAPTQVSTNDATMRSDDSGRAAPEDATLPAAGVTEAGVTEDGARFAVGSRLGRYEITGLLGRGGMGEVYAAYDPQLDRFVAVKVLLAEIRSDAASARLVREAQALARLQHPNVVAVYDAGEDRGHVYLAMQYVEGETLLTHLRDRPRTWQQIVGLFVEAGRGLAAAHAAGMIHRDFKPSNVLVDRAGRVAVTDFGVARAASGQPDAAAAEPLDPTVSASISMRRASRPSYDANLTRVGELVGTPVYMSPEQFTGGTTTAASDQFAFCVAVWEALHGCHPYYAGSEDASPLAYGAAVQDDPLIMPARSAVPRRVVAALARGLDRDPAMRWPAMDALLAELVGTATGRRRWPWAVAVGAAVVAAGAVAVAVVARDDEAALCPEPADRRLAKVWGSAPADALTTAFAATNRTYAATVAASVTSELDAYGARWIEATAAACAAHRRPDPARAPAATELACLDRAHDAFAAAIRRLTREATGDVVDRAEHVLDGLPAIADCASDTAAPPSPAVARELAVLEPRLADATAHVRVGQYQRAKELLDELERDAAALAWEPFLVRLAYQVAWCDAHLGTPSYAAFSSVARRLGAIGAHRLAVDAWANAALWAPDGPTLDAAVAGGATSAERLGGGRLSLEVTLAQGRGLVRQRRWPEAASLCSDGITVARANGWIRAEEKAADCLAEALTPLGRRAELEPILEWNIAAKTSRLGGEHPAVADLLMVRADMFEDQGNHAEAEATLRRALDIRKRAFGDRDLRVADTIRELAGVVVSAGDVDRALEVAGEALVIGESHTPPPDQLLSKVHRDLGMYRMQQEDFPAVRRHFDLAVASAERFAGPDSLEVGFLLLMYGQYQSAWDLDLGIATLRRTITILEAHDDGRVAVVRAALAGILEHHERWADARALLEDAIDKIDKVNTPPALLAQVHHSLARVLVNLKGGDRARAHEVARIAMDYYAQAGKLDSRQAVLDYIKRHRLGPRR